MLRNYVYVFRGMLTPLLAPLRTMGFRRTGMKPLLYTDSEVLKLDYPASLVFCLSSEPFEPLVPFEEDETSLPFYLCNCTMFASSNVACETGGFCAT
jgi:hypothetical protein